MTPHSRLVWTNEEGDNGKTVTTVTFDENAGKTLLVVHDRYPSMEVGMAAMTYQAPMKRWMSTLSTVLSLGREAASTVKGSKPTRSKP